MIAPRSQPRAEGVGGGPRVHLKSSKKCAKRGPFGGLESRDQCADALVAESSQRFDTKHFRGRVSGSSDGQMTAPHGGESKSTLTPAGIDYDGTP